MHKCMYLTYVKFEKIKIERGGENLLKAKYI